MITTIAFLIAAAVPAHASWTCTLAEAPASEAPSRLSLNGDGFVLRGPVTIVYFDEPRFDEARGTWTAVTCRIDRYGSRPAYFCDVLTLNPATHVGRWRISVVVPSTGHQHHLDMGLDCRR